MAIAPSGAQIQVSWVGRLDQVGGWWVLKGTALTGNQGQQREVASFEMRVYEGGPELMRDCAKAAEFLITSLTTQKISGLIAGIGRGN